MTKGEILKALPKLSRADLEAITAVAQSLLGASQAPKAGSAAPLAAQLFEGISGALNLNASYGNMPAVLKVKLDAKAADLTGFFDRSFKGWDSNKTRQRKFLLFMFGLLREDLKRLKLKPTLTTMINNLHRMTEVFDDAFPGYRASGLASMVFRFTDAKLD
jgi:hypothetical protein